MKKAAEATRRSPRRRRSVLLVAGGRGYPSSLPVPITGRPQSRRPEGTEVVDNLPNVYVNGSSLTDEWFSKLVFWGGKVPRNSLGGYLMRELTAESAARRRLAYERLVRQMRDHQYWFDRWPSCNDRQDGSLYRSLNRLYVSFFC